MIGLENERQSPSRAELRYRKKPHDFPERHEESRQDNAIKSKERFPSPENDMLMQLKGVYPDRSSILGKVKNGNVIVSRLKPVKAVKNWGVYMLKQVHRMPALIATDTSKVRFRNVNIGIGG